MSPGLTADLAFAGAVVFLAAWLLLKRLVGARVALVLVLLRVGLCVAYFGFLDDGSWRLRDDLAYAEEALALGSAHGGASAVLLSSEGVTLLGAAAGGKHFGYHAYNLVAIALFGEHYWSAVLLNVLMSFVAVLALLSMARSAGFGESLRVPLASAFLLHPDVIAWSSFFNLKDTLALTLTAWLFALTLRLQKRLSPGLILWALAVAATLAVVRSYLIVLYGLSVVCWALLHARWMTRILVLAVGVLSLPLVPRIGIENFQPSNAPAGLVDFLLTPRPWGVQRSYEFLVIPSTFHWLMFPVPLWGALWLWRRGGSAARLPLIYGAVLVAFYSCVPLLAGPRHRFQLVFVLVSVQVAGVYALSSEVLARRFGARAPAQRLEQRPLASNDQAVRP